jgi:hypothetical protein
MDWVFFFKVDSCAVWWGDVKQLVCGAVGVCLLWHWLLAELPWIFLSQ